MLAVPLWVSVGGFSAGDFAHVCERLEGRNEVDTIELNLSCPNVEEAPESSAQASGLSVAESALMGVRPQAEQRGVELDLQLLDSGSALLGSVGALLQILTNLLLNAIDFSPRGTTVSLAVREDGASLVFSVSDEGPGIDPERVATLLSAPVSTRRGGAGDVVQSAPCMIAPTVPTRALPVGLREARAETSSSARLEKTRAAANEARTALLESGPPLFVKEAQLITLPYPSTYAFTNFASSPAPYILFTTKLHVVRFTDPTGTPCSRTAAPLLMPVASGA